MRVVALNWAALNWVDWAIIAILTFSTVLSLWRGFAREALSLAAWVAAFIIANLLAQPLSDQLLGTIENDTARHVAAFGALFVATLLAGSLLTVLVSQFIRLTGLGTLDRLLGTVFGFTRGLIVVMALIFVARQMLPVPEQVPLNESLVMPHLDLLVAWAQTTFNDLGGLSAAGISV